MLSGVRKEFGGADERLEAAIRQMQTDEALQQAREILMVAGSRDELLRQLRTGRNGSAAG